MGCREGNAKREIYCKRRNISNQQSNVLPLGTRKRKQTKPKASRREILYIKYT